jgi:hypothetical protein
MSVRDKSKLIPSETKLEILKLLLEETQKYELLTTNQYLPQIELVVGILEGVSGHRDEVRAIREDLNELKELVKAKLEDS